jgi:hypothetical protein
MEEYGLSPDELIAKQFRIIQSSRRGYQPLGKSDWVAAIKKVYKRDGNVFAKRLQKNIHTSIRKAFGFSAIGITLCVQRNLIQNGCGYTPLVTGRRS